MKDLIIGAGEIGKALFGILSPHYKVILIDKTKRPLAGHRVRMLHVCFPYADRELFINEVRRYQALFRPQYTVIHSTVPVGTSTLCQAAHSPVRGNHPDLLPALRTFVKFVGGKDADKIGEYFHRAGFRIFLCRKSETTELAKLLCTTFYGVCLQYTKEAERECEKQGVPFAEAWTLFQQTYNDGYQRLGRPEFTRPILTPIQNKIGGHCILPNCDLFDFQFARIVKKLDGEIK